VTVTFLDASGWFAALSPKDQRFASAAPYYQSLLGGRGRIVTTNLVIAEVHALLARASAEVGVRFLDRVYADPRHETIWTSRDLERAAIDRWLRPFLRVGFSLTDAVSFEVMRAHGISRAFAFDQHFAAAGFELVP
jgi:predicted nucleic acid-binding protein